MESGAGGPRPDVAGAARHLLGFASLHPGQEEAVRAVVGGSDVLVVMPTGAGKSAGAGYRLLSERLAPDAGVLSEVPGKRIVP